MSRKHKHKNIGTGVAILSLSVILLLAGTYMAMQSSASNADIEENSRPSGNTAGNRHYAALETVVLPDSTESRIKEYIGFTISFNKNNRTPNYVAWELLGNETSGTTRRSNKFWTDSELEGCPDNSDYVRSGYDRGHMCPSADQKWSQEAMDDCFVMSNICPQAHALNNGAWKTLENKARLWAERDSAIMIVAGPIYTPADTMRIGKAGIRVPGAFFKVLAAPYLDEPRGIAFVYPNMAAPGNMQNYAMSIDALEKLIGYDFFPSLPDVVEEKVESTYSFKEWNNSKK